VTVTKLIGLLQQCNPEAEVVARLPFGGGSLDVPNVVVREAHQGGVGPRFSFEKIPTIEVCLGDLEYMRNQGMDVIG